MIQETVGEINENTSTDTFKILDPSNNIEIIIISIHMINLQSILHLIPTQTSLESHQSLLSELSIDKSDNSVVEPILHIFKTCKGKLRRNGYWLCKLKFKIDDRFNHWGVMFPMLNVGERMVEDGSDSNGVGGEDGDYFGVFKVDELVPEDKMADEMYRISSEQDLISIGQQSLNGNDEELSITENNETIESFSMRPPSSIQNRPGDFNGHGSPLDPGSNFTSPSKSEESQDPLQFLTNRYYHSLYSLNEPLSYFPKTSLTRFINLCQGNDSLTIAILDSLILSMEKFDLRYDGKSNGEFFISEIGSLSDCELRNQERFKERVGFNVKLNTEDDDDEKYEEVGLVHLNGIDNNKLQKLILELKIREAQLQIILLFEVLQNLNINEDEFLKLNLQKLNELMMKQSQDKQKVSLVRKKRKLYKPMEESNERNNSKKKSKCVKPTTLLGPSTLNELKNREFDYYLYLNKLIDRLNLWEVLMVSDKHEKQGDSSTDGTASSSYGFLAYVLVPYYGKTFPVLMKYVIQNMKNTNMKLTSNHKKQKKNKSKSKKRSSASSTVIEIDGDEDSNEHNKDAGNRNGGEKKKSKLERKPLLNNDNGNLIKDISIASLKRSKSNLGGQSSRELLDKRQVDLNFKPPHLKKQISSNLDSGMLSTSSLIFGQARRSRTLAGGETLAKSGSSSVVNVAETPMKAAQRGILPTGAGTGFSNGGFGGNLMKSFSQIEATPAKQRVVDLEVFTPVTKLSLRSNENIIRENEATNSIFTSPATGDGIEGGNGASPFLKPGSSMMTQRLQSVASSVAATTVAATIHQGEDVHMVAATPKKQRTDDAAAVVETPHDMIVEATPVRNDQRTPQLHKHLDPSIIQATPVQKITKLQSFSNTLADAIVQDIPQQGQKQNIQSPFMRRNEEGDTTFKSPVAMQKGGMFSSPLVHKTKPGDPIAISESPIYNAYANTGLLSLRKKEIGEEEGDDNEAYDSDEILNPKKKKARATYSRR